MYSIVVVDRSAESRNRLVERIQEILRDGVKDFHFIPRTSVKPLSPEELKFHAAPHICILGEEVVQADITEVQRIRKLIPTSTLMVKVPPAWATLSSIEHLGRAGVDEVIVGEISASAFLQKIILLSQKVSKSHQGRLILVGSGKGGVGVTSVAAAIAEGVVDSGKRVVLVDFDFETQDASRFLQARPFVNENLQLLIDEQAPVTADRVRESLVQVWLDEPNFQVMPPFPESRLLFEQSTQVVRAMLSVFEQLDAMTDYVVVDSGCASGALLEMLYRIADNVVYLVPNDPAALYASVDRVGRCKWLLGESASFAILENRICPHGLSSRLLAKDFNQAAGLDAEAWIEEGLPFCREALRWPGSGGTMWTEGGAGLRRSVEGILVRMGVREERSSQAQRSIIEKVTAPLAGIGARMKSALALKRRDDSSPAQLEGPRSAPAALPAPSAAVEAQAVPALLLPERPREEHVPLRALFTPAVVEELPEPILSNKNPTVRGGRLISGATIS